MYKMLFISIIFLLSYPVHANRNDHSSSPKNKPGSFKTFSPKEIKDLSFGRIQQLRRAYIDFLYWVEKRPPQKSQTNFNPREYFNLLILNEAYAAGQKVCFFAGWPSTYENGKCRNPQLKNSQPNIEHIDPYAPDEACTGSDRFRCNPALFGTPSLIEMREYDEIMKVDGVEVYTDSMTNRLSQEGSYKNKGFCINTNGSFNNLTEKCEKATRDNIEALAAFYKENPEKLSAFSQVVEAFCGENNKYDACDALNKRISDIQNKQNGIVEKIEEKQTKEIVASNGEDLLSRCNQLMEESNLHDPRGRKLLSKYGSCPSGNYQNKTWQDIENIVDKSNFPNQVKNINALNYKQTVKALLINELKRPGGKADLNLSEIKGDLDKVFPGNTNEPYKTVFQEALGEVQQMSVPPINMDVVNEEHKKLSTEVNNFCGEMNREFKEKFGGGLGFWGKVNAWTTGFESERLAFINKKEKELLHKVDELAKKQSYGPLIATDSFRKDVFDPSTDNAYNCIVDDKYIPMKTTLDSNLINNAQDNLKKNMAENVDLIKQHQSKIEKGKADDLFKEYMTYDPGLVGMTLKSLPADQQESFASKMCVDSKKIYKDDKFNKNVGLGLSVIGAGLGIALMFTGVGAPLGAALLFGDIAVSAYGLKMAYDDHVDASTRLDYLETQVGQERADNFAEDFYNVSDQNKEAKKEAVLSVVGLVSSGLQTKEAIGGIKAWRAGTEAIEVADDINTTAHVVDAVDESIEISRDVAKMEDVADSTADVERIAKAADETVDGAREGENLAEATEDVVDGVNLSKAKPPIHVNAGDMTDITAEMQQQLMGRLRDASEEVSKAVKDLDIPPTKSFVAPDGTTIHLSDAFDGSDGRAAHMAYIEMKDGQIYHRVVYNSKSAGGWRFADYYTSYHIGKGVGEEYMSVPPQLQKILTENIPSNLTKIDESKLYDLDKLAKDQGNLTIIAGGHKRAGTLIQGEIFTEIDGLESGRKFLPKYEIKPDVYRELSDPKTLIPKQNLKPNFSNPIDSYKGSTNFGPVDIELFPSENGELIYTMMKGKDGKVWIGNVYPKNAQLNEFGIPKTQYKLDELTSPRYEYFDQIHPNYRGPKKDTHYSSNWNYLREIPIIKDYYRAKSIPLPAAD